MLDGGLYRLFADPMAPVHSKRNLDKPSRSKKAYVEHAWHNAMETESKPIMKSRIDSKFATDRSFVEYKDKVVGFPQREEVDLDITLVPRFSQKEGVHHVEGFVSVARGFEEHGKDAHDYRLLTLLARDVDLRDNGVRHVAYHPRLYSFESAGCKHSLDIRDAMITFCVIGYSDTAHDLQDLYSNKLRDCDEPRCEV